MTSDNRETQSKSSRTILFSGDVTETNVKTVMERMVELAESDSSPITLVINTLGGDVYETMALYDLMKFLKTPVYTVGLGKIMSAGALLLCAGTSGHRLIGRNAMLMYHQGADHNFGDVWQQERRLEEFKRQEKQYDLLVAKETGLTYEQVFALYSDKLDNYLDCTQAVKLGFADGIIG